MFYKFTAIHSSLNTDLIKYAKVIMCSKHKYGTGASVPGLNITLLCPKVLAGSVL